MGLRFKYNLVLLLACLLGLAGAAGISYTIVQRFAIEEIKHSINIVHANANAVRFHTVKSVTPLLSEDNDILFLPETVASFAAQSVFARMQEDFPEYSYKEAALNPTNPADLANPLEASMIRDFRADASLTEISTVVENENGSFLTMAYPITITQEGCLRCHSTPEAAPPAMVDLYGSDNGFGWELGETVGAQIISAPMSLVQQRTWETGVVLIAGLSTVFLFVFAMTNLMLGRIVLKPVRQMSQVAEQVSMGDFSVPEYQKPGNDEISSLTTSFNRMRRSLEQAMRMIDD
ncbi:DUF3365 domain-containing protein [Tateyamaria sp.]|jgi:protein-histidine pros-kinase|uniref:c-type heme family protein n=1 Tax=Tateyamaria sp. TaxID=1929288 RepID=UPI00329B2566